MWLKMGGNRETTTLTLSIGNHGFLKNLKIHERQAFDEVIYAIRDILDHPELMKQVRARVLAYAQKRVNPGARKTEA